jgi:signal transduction histidine kinase
MSAERLTEIQSPGTGIGIRGMSERVRHFRDDLVIESKGSGTRVHAIIPLTTFAIHKGRTPEEVLEANARSLQ